MSTGCITVAKVGRSRLSDSISTAAMRENKNNKGRKSRAVDWTNSRQAALNSVHLDQFLEWTSSASWTAAGRSGTVSGSIKIWSNYKLTAKEKLKFKIYFGFLIVSSTDKIRHVASAAALNALILTREGSHTHFSRLSATSSFKISTPNQQCPEIYKNQRLSNTLDANEFIEIPCACFCRSLLRILVESNPALSHSCRGMTSSARAKALIKSCSLPAMLRDTSRKYFDNSISMAPPPVGKWQARKTSSVVKE